MNHAITSVDLGLAEAGLAHGCSDCGSGSARSGGSHACGGGCGCGTSALERPRWFAGQLVGPSDLEAVQQWVLARSRRHNRTLHGWGVVCGLAVTATTSPVTGESMPWSVTIDAGLALSGCGDEVSVPCAVRVDIRQPRPAGSDACAPPADPWCAPVRQRRDPARNYYLAVRYAEDRRRPVPAASCGCGCDDDPCEYSRIAETVAIGVLDELPDCYGDGEAANGRADLGGRASAAGCSPEIRESGTRPCPDCRSPWVVLADMRVSPNGTVEVDPLAHRRFVAALPGLAFTCGPMDRNPGPRPLSPAARDTIATAFSSAAEAIARTADRDIVLAQPATLLKGGRGSTAIRNVLGDLSVADLADTDPGELRHRAAEASADPESVVRLQDLARVVIQLTH